MSEPSTPRVSTETVLYRPSTTLPGVVSMHVENSSRLWRNFHETYTICCTRQSPGRWADWVYRGRRQRAHDGLLMLMEPGEFHSNLRIGGPLSFETVLLPPSLIESHAREMGVRGKPHFSLAQVDEPQIYGALVRFFASICTAASRLEQESRLAHCLRLLLRRCSEAPPTGAMGRENTAVRRVRDFLRDRPTENVSLDSLVSVTGLSRCHVVHAFTRAMGIPPHEYHLLVRIERGRHLLEIGANPGDVAAELGFADQSHFGRHFRRIVGLSPGRYRYAVRRTAMAF